METTRIKRILFLLPVATLLVVHNIRADGWAATLQPLKLFFFGGIGLIILFKLLGWM